MKYESTILKRLIDTYGVVGNPRYISEIIKEFIVRGKERFPELFTYQADWLEHIDEFGLNPSYTVSYTGQSIYAPNTLERPVKSAILKGQTLVNLASNNYVLKNTSKIENGFKFDAKTSNSDHTLTFQVQAKSDTYYTYIFNSDTAFEFMTGYDATDNDGWVQPTYKAIIGLNAIKVKTEVNNENKNLAIRTTSNRVGNNDVLLTNFMLLEGDYTSVDIPYFTGMQSVQMPGLTTTGKNLFDIKEDTIAWNGANIKSNSDNTITFTPDSNNNASLSGNLYFKQHIKVKTGTKYTYSMKRISGGNSDFSGTINNQILIIKKDGTIANVIGMYDFNASTFNQTLSVTYVFDDTIESIIGVSPIMYAVGNLTSPIIMQFQLEENSVATPYEPFKSNSLTVNEDVELRGIGDVQDTLDCLTGEVTERITEIVLDGSEDWKKDGNAGYCLTMNDLIRDSNYQQVLTSDRLPIGKLYNSSYTTTTLSGYTKNNLYPNQNWLYIVGSEFSTIDELKTWLSQNPTTVQYRLATESIKTVDLTIKDHNGQNVKQLMSFNGGTHFNTRSSEGSPQPSVSVSVETDLEETLMVCSLEGNTM